MTTIQKVAVRYQFGHFFCQLLERLAARLTQKPKLQQVVLENLAEEAGYSSTYPGPAHQEGRKRLLEALGVKYPEWEPMGTLDSPTNIHAAAANVLRKFVALVDQPDPVIGFGAIAESEGMVVGQYNRLVSMLRTECPGLTNYDMEHLLSHIQHDTLHRNDMLMAVETADQQAATEGARAARAAWEEFWMELEQ